MNEFSAQDWLVIAGCFVAVAALYAAPNLWAVIIAAPADAKRIKLLYESITGPAGPNIKVLSVVRKGTIWGRDPTRTYYVELEKLNGVRSTRIVDVPASIWGDGPILKDR